MARACVTLHPCHHPGTAVQTPQLLIVVEDLAAPLRMLDAALTQPHLSAAGFAPAAPCPDLDSACLGLARDVNAVLLAFSALDEMTSSCRVEPATFDLHRAAKDVALATQGLATTYLRMARQALQAEPDSQPHARLAQAARDGVITAAHVLASTIEQCLVVFGLAASGFNARREVSGSFRLPDDAADLPSFVPTGLTYDHPATLRALGMAQDCRRATAQPRLEAPPMPGAWATEPRHQTSAWNHLCAAVIGLWVGHWLVGSDDD